MSGSNSVSLQFKLTNVFLGMMETKVHAAYAVIEDTVQKEMERLCEGEQAHQFSPPHGYIDRYTLVPVGTAIPVPQYHCGTHDAIQLSEYIRFLNQHELCPFKACRARALRDICSAMNSPLNSLPSRADRMIDTSECRACITPLAAILIGISEKVSKELDNLCLQCVRSGEEHANHL